MKVLQIITASRDGATRWVLNQGKELVKRGVTCDVLHLSEIDDYFKSTVQSWEGRLMYLPHKRYSNELVMTQLFEYGLGDYDVYHFQGMTKSYLRIYDLMQQLGFKGRVLFHAHNIQGPYSKVFSYNHLPKEQLEELQRYAACSTLPVGCGREVIRSWYGQELSDEEMVVLPNSLAIEEYIKSDVERAFIKRQFRSYHQIPEDHQVLGFIGRVSEGKNLEFILDLAEASLKAGDPLTYVIVGIGNVDQALKADVIKSQLTNVRLILEWRDDVADIMTFFDGLLLPSLFEGVPNVVIEAQATGAPAFISSRIDKEVDLGLGLVHFLTIDDPKSVGLWRDQVLTVLATAEQPDAEIRLKAFQTRGYDNRIAAQHYLTMLETLKN